MQLFCLVFSCAYNNNLLECHCVSSKQPGTDTFIHTIAVRKQSVGNLNTTVVSSHVPINNLVNVGLGRPRITPSLGLHKLSTVVKC